MENYKELAERLMAVHSEKSASPALCVTGLDGFTDEICSIVKKRPSKDEFQSIEKMEELSEIIAKAAGRSCNLEVVVKRTKVGGNAPIMTEALLEGGHKIVFAGAIGEPERIEPLFEKMASRCEKAIAICPSAHTDAIEFQNGKVMLGKMEPLLRITYENLLKSIPKEKWIKLLDDCDLFASVNWTMLPHLSGIWEKMAEELLPSLSDRRRWFFVDLADPAKRTKEELKNALLTIRKFNGPFSVILGLNEAEAEQVADVLECDPSPDKIREAAGISIVLIHKEKDASGANESECVHIDGPYTSHPVLSTGAGDNFNAGFCNGLLYGMNLSDSLTLGVYTSGFYVRNGKSPTMMELAEFLKERIKEEAK